MISQIDIVPPTDPTSWPTITAGQLGQLFNQLAPYADKGFVITTADILGTPEVPDAETSPKWQKYLWSRVTATTAILYVWNPVAASLPTYLKWQPVVVAAIEDGTLNGSKLIDNSVLSAKIVSLDWNKLINTPANVGTIIGIYPNLTIAIGGITSSKLASDPAISANRAVTGNHIQDGAIKTNHLSAEVAANFTAPPGAVMAFARKTAPDGWLLCDGAKAVIADNAALATAIYVGDLNNNDVTLEYGYKCDSGGARTIAGLYIKLPDLRGQFIRGWNGEGTGIDASRAWASAQLDDIKAHTHDTLYNGLGAANSGAGFKNDTGVAATVNKALSAPATDHAPNPATAGRDTLETRPYNMAFIYCIKT